VPLKGAIFMAESTSLVKQLLDSGVHFGHKAAGWNPKMQPYIFTKRNGIHIIDVRQTVRGLLLAKKLLTQVVAGGKDVLIVGTKRRHAPPSKLTPPKSACPTSSNAGSAERSPTSAPSGRASSDSKNSKP